MISALLLVLSGQVILKEDGSTVGSVLSINCSGSGVTCSRVGSAGTLAVTSGSGTVTSVAVTPANGLSCVVTNPTTTPDLTCSLGAITPSSVAATGAVSGTNLSGTNTGDQTKTCTSQFMRTLAAGTSSTCASVDIADHSATGTPSATTFLRGDNTWATPAGGGGGGESPFIRILGSL